MSKDFEGFEEEYDELSQSPDEEADPYDFAVGGFQGRAKAKKPKLDEKTFVTHL